MGEFIIGALAAVAIWQLLRYLGVVDRKDHTL